METVKCLICGARVHVSEFLKHVAQHKDDYEEYNWWMYVDQVEHQAK